MAGKPKALQEWRMKGRMLTANTPSAPRVAESCASPRTPNPESKRLISLIWAFLVCCRIAQEVCLGCFLFPFRESHLRQHCSPPSGCSSRYPVLSPHTTDHSATCPAKGRGKSRVWHYQHGGFPQRRLPTQPDSKGCEKKQNSNVQV